MLAFLILHPIRHLNIGCIGGMVSCHTGGGLFGQGFRCSAVGKVLEVIVLCCKEKLWSVWLVSSENCYRL